MWLWSTLLFHHLTGRGRAWTPGSGGLAGGLAGGVVGSRLAAGHRHALQLGRAIDPHGSAVTYYGFLDE
jgi:hypothetical protein